MARQQESGYLTPGTADFLRPEHREAFARSGDFRSHTLEDLERNDRIAWGAPEEVRDRLIALAEALGAGTLTLNFNQGAMPHEMFMQNVQRVAPEVLPALKAHEVTTVPVA